MTIRAQPMRIYPLPYPRPSPMTACGSGPSLREDSHESCIVVVVAPAAIALLHMPIPKVGVLASPHVQLWRKPPPDSGVCRRCGYLRSRTVKGKSAHKGRDRCGPSSSSPASPFGLARPKHTSGPSPRSKTVENESVRKGRDRRQNNKTESLLFFALLSSFVDYGS